MLFKVMFAYAIIINNFPFLFLKGIVIAILQHVKTEVLVVIWAIHFIALVQKVGLDIHAIYVSSEIFYFTIIFSLYVNKGIWINRIFLNVTFC